MLKLLLFLLTCIHSFIHLQRAAASSQPSSTTPRRTATPNSPAPTTLASSTTMSWSTREGTTTSQTASSQLLAKASTTSPSPCTTWALRSPAPLSRLTAWESTRWWRKQQATHKIVPVYPWPSVWKQETKCTWTSRRRVSCALVIIFTILSPVFCCTPRLKKREM